MKKGGGGGGGSKQKGQEKIAPLHFIPKMHISNTLHQIDSSYQEKTSVKLILNKNLVITNQMISGWPCNGTYNGGIYWSSTP